ncbi:unnamed protein product, partial [Prorocentrum cordatum]
EGDGDVDDILHQTYSELHGAISGLRRYDLHEMLLGFEHLHREAGQALVARARAQQAQQNNWSVWGLLAGERGAEQPPDQDEEHWAAVRGWPGPSHAHCVELCLGRVRRVVGGGCEGLYQAVQDEGHAGDTVDVALEACGRAYRARAAAEDGPDYRRLCLKECGHHHRHDEEL